MTLSPVSRLSRSRVQTDLYALAVYVAEFDVLCEALGRYEVVVVGLVEEVERVSELFGTSRLFGKTLACAPPTRQGTIHLDD